MVYPAKNDSTNEISVNLSRSFVDKPQPVSVQINGFSFPGEVIFAEQWQAWFGSNLSERTMFRLVLLSENWPVDQVRITEKFIAVAVPPAEGKAYGSSEFTQLNRELGRLNEIRERYIVSGDYELHSLTTSLTNNTSRAQRDVTEALAERWRVGDVIANAHNGTTRLQPDSIFVGEDPAAWVEAVAATFFTRPTGELNSNAALFEPAAIFTEMLNEDESAWKPALDSRIQLATGLPLDAIAEELDITASARSEARKSGQVQGAKLRDLLIRHHGLPSGLASLLVVAYVKIRNGEASITSNESGTDLRLDRHSLGTFIYNPELIYSLNWLSPGHAGDWNSALPYVRVLLPHANPTESGEPAQDTETEFMQALGVTESRITLTLHTLENVSGPAIESMHPVKLAKRLVPVLQAGNWRQFYSLARETFPNVVEFSEAIGKSSQLRVLSEDIVDVQAAHNYMASADFGRVDHGLAKDALVLLETVDVTAILESGAPASAELQKFHNWKRLFTVAYMEHHAKRRSADLELARRVRDADAQHVAVRNLAAIPELEGIYNAEFAEAWEELKERVKPCENSDHEVALQRQPYCIDCGIRLGSPGYEDEVEERISEIENMLRRSVNHLSQIAASRALSGEREDELRKLININSIADLTAVSQVLDAGVLTFLKRFASNSASAD